MNPAAAERRLAAIMFSDIVGYTALMAGSEEKGLRARERHRAVVEPNIAAYGGELVDENGDELVVIFPSAFDAVNCALVVQTELAGPDDLRLRIGIHSGDVLFREGRVYGDGVNVASRIRALAEPGGICVSDEVQHSIQNQANVETRALGEHQLRNVPRAIPVFSLSGTALAPSRAAAGPARARSPLPPWLGSAVAALAVVGLAVWWLATSALDSGEIRSLVVLPLENLSGDPSQEYFADGMTEALTFNLAKLGALRVISRTSAMRYKGAGKPLPDIARELDVDAVIEGSVMREADRVRITAQLVHAPTDRHLWAESYDREMRNVLALQADIARAIARAVELELTPQEAARMREDRPVDPAAYEAYLRGRHQWNRRSPEGLRRGVEYFRRAIETDPTFAPAHAGLADSHAILASWFGDPPREAMPRARAAAEQAIAIDDELGEAHASLAAVMLWYDWDWPAAEREFRRSIELNPSYATAPFWYCELLYGAGRIEEALVQLERAQQLDPLSPLFSMVLAIRYAEIGEAERAIAAWRATLELDPDFLMARVNFGLELAFRGEFDRALDLLRETVERWPRDPFVIGRLAEVLALSGGHSEARGLIPRMKMPDGSDRPDGLARLYAAMNEPDLAFEWLERAYQERHRIVTFLTYERIFDPIRDDPRFAELVRRVGIPRSPAS